jgi:hypothetical protein
LETGVDIHGKSGKNNKKLQQKREKSSKRIKSGGKMQR